MLPQIDADFTSHHIEGIAHQGNKAFKCPLISQIDENFFQGGCINGVSLGNTFKHIISLYPWERFRTTNELDSFTEVRLYDGPDVPNEQQLHSLAAWINICRQHGRTLVHCQAGLNRSGLLAGLALVKSGMNAKDAIAKLRSGRCDAVLCNPSFSNWLLGQDE